jgi:outer membrane receptor protein involved in Fe transport
MPPWLPVRLARVLVCIRTKSRSLAFPSMTRLTATRLAATWLVFLLNESPIFAQSVDYAGFEQLFGEPVTTSATGKPQRISEVPANMEIITADDIRRSGADNIPDILQFVAGISVRRYGFAAADVGIRGYNETSNPRLLVLLNGQQVYLDDLGRTQWYTLPVTLEEIRQIEIIKGPNTALFGFNAVSGVINIITYDPLQESVNSATLRGGTQGYASLSAVGTGRIADVGGVRVAADGFRAQEYDATGVAAGDLPFREAPQRGAFNIDARVQATSNVRLFASAAVVDTQVWEATSSPYYGTDYERTNWSRVGLAADTRYGLLSLSATEMSCCMCSAAPPNGKTLTTLSPLYKPATSSSSKPIIRYGLDSTIETIRPTPTPCSLARWGTTSTPAVRCGTGRSRPTSH